MSLRQVYVNEDVVAAARKRISFVFDEFEDIVVSVSGGKDSTVIAHLALSEANRRNRRIGVFFLDEEVVYESTIEQVEHLMNLYPENTNPLWLQIEFNLTNATSYKDPYLRCWERGKHKIWMRSKKSYAIQHKPWPESDEVILNRNIGLDFYAVIENFQRTRPGAAFLIGNRAVESMNRWRSVSKNPGYKDVFWCTKSGEVYNFYPIYDWNFHDVWKYIYDQKLRYSRIYDYMWKKGMGINEIRVSSLIHEKSFNALVELPEFEPRTYDLLLKRVSGMSIGHIYGKDRTMMQARRLPQRFKDWREYRDFLLKTYPDPERKKIFERRFARHLDNDYVARQQCRQLLINDYENNLPIDNKPDPRMEAIEKWRRIL